MFINFLFMSNEEGKTSTGFEHRQGSSTFITRKTSGNSYKKKARACNLVMILTKLCYHQYDL